MKCGGLVKSRLSYGSNLEYYSLTEYGCYKAYYWYNRECFDEIYHFLRDKGYNKKHIALFMGEWLSYYQHTYKWKFHDCDLEDNYLSWCENNNIEPRTGKLGRILKIIRE